MILKRNFNFFISLKKTVLINLDKSLLEMDKIHLKDQGNS